MLIWYVTPSEGGGTFNTVVLSHLENIDYFRNEFSYIYKCEHICFARNVPLKL